MKPFRALTLLLLLLAPSVALAGGKAVCQYGRCNGVCVEPNNLNATCGKCKPEQPEQPDSSPNSPNSPSSPNSKKQCPATFVCVEKVCRCPSEFSNCFRNGTNSCVNFRNDSVNCGACGVKCPLGTSCVNGTCRCPVDLTLCSGQCLNLSNDSGNCGACGTSCTGGTSCVNGACACPAGLTLCFNQCVNLFNDSGSCGACGIGCPAGTSCADGICVCPANLTLCSGSCFDLFNDSGNCGACELSCPNGTSCADGICMCPSDLTLCSGQCFNLFNDSGNCGDCGITCPNGTSCADGICVCPANLTLCSGSCFDLFNDSGNCGACNFSCPNGTSCLNGTCVAPQQQCGCGAALNSSSPPIINEAAEITNSQGQTVVGNRISENLGNIREGSSIAISCNAQTLAMLAAGRIDIYNHTSLIPVNQWNHTQTLSTVGYAINTLNPNMVAISNDGNTLVAVVREGGPAKVIVYRRGEDGLFSLLQLLDAGVAPFVIQNSITISGDAAYIAVGAPALVADGVSSGGTYVYAFNGTGYNFQEILIGQPATGSQQQQGYSVALNCDGSVLAVGAPFRDGVFIFYRNDSSWSQGPFILYDPVVAGKRHGISVAISFSGRTVAVGTRNQWATLIWDQLSNGSWVNTRYFNPLETRIGVSISITGDGNTVASGATGSTQYEVRVYKRAANDLPFLQYSIFTLVTADEFGADVALDPNGGLLAVGTPLDGSTNVGAVYTYVTV